MRRRRSGWIIGHKVELSWWGTPAIALRPCPGRARLALIGAYVLAGELVAASGAYPAAFDHYEKEMRPFVALNQALGIKSANLMKSKEKENVFSWLLEQIMRIAPALFINRSTQRIHQAANAITLKDYSA
jgi:2-polyprenyl-6-methoxyphenol hydroxylase-like FAD-dependent oxidoreductase